MNHVYRLVWSNVRNGWVAVAEIARGRRKGCGRSRLAMALSLTAVLAHAGQPGVVGGHVVAGSGEITTSGNTTTITQSSPTLSLTWLSFDVGPQQTVDFVQPSASSIAINDILSTTASEILGHLDANGQIYLINPNGIIFGKGAQVNVGGLVASTLRLDEYTLSGDSRTFSGTGTGSVINRGSITAANGGFVALVGNTVINQGSIVARLGSVALGAGSSVTLTFASDALVGVQVDKSTLHSLAANGGLIQADGGHVTMTAGAKDALLASVVNNTGVIEARTVEDHDGTITLLGGMTAGTVNVGGTLDGSAPNGGNGGSIETSAAHVQVASGTKVTTAATHGLVGSWVIDPQNFTVAASGGDETGAQLSTALASTNVELESSAGASSGSGNVNIDDAVTWSANTTLTLTASNNVNVNASVTATGSGAGLVINPNTANGAETASGGGTLNLAPGAAINLPDVPASSTSALVISGQPYTVLNSLGAAGSATGTDLQGMSANVGGYYALGSDIDASTTSSWNGGEGFTPIGNSSAPFTGTFNGLGHSITGLVIDLPNDDVGLFGVSRGSIRNVGLAGAAVTGGAYSVGGLVGLNYGTVTDSYVTGNVAAALNSTGGLVGLNYGAISGSYMSGTVSGVDNVGGLVGHNKGTIADSFMIGTVSGAFDIGGLVGDAGSGTIEDSYAASAVSGYNNIGGLVGYGRGDAIEYSFATGSVSGNDSIGGLVGANYGTISTSYAAAAVSGNGGLGGLVGSGNSSAVSDSFWDVTASGQSSSGGGTGLTTTQMQTATDLTGLGFTTTPGVSGNTWVIVDTDGTLNNAGGAAGATLPMLASEYTTDITNAQQLQLIAMAPATSYSLGADMDATATDGSGGVWGSSGFVPIGSSTTPFSGTFDGLGHTISNLTISRPGASDVGLFGYTGGTSLVTNVALAGAGVAGYGTAGALIGHNGGVVSNSSSAGNVSGSSTIGGLVGANYGTIAGSSSSATVAGSEGGIGGLVGHNFGTLSASHATGDVTSSNYGVGGLVGASFTGGSISNSYATGDVTDSGGYGNRAGGLVGTAYGGTITGSHAAGAVSGYHAIGGLVGASWATITSSYATGTVAASYGQGGGLVGVNLGPVSESYATGAVSGSGSQFGGLAGGNGGAISNSYATGAVDAPTSYVGGLVGGNYGTVNNSYSAGAVTGSSNVGGLIGGNQYGQGSTSNSFWDETASGQTVSAGGMGLTTAQMQQQSSFPGWNFANTWIVYGGATDPLLQVFMTPLTVTASNATVTYDGAGYSGGAGVIYSTTPDSNLLSTLAYGGSSQGARDVGTYTITPRLYSSQQGYLITAVSGTLTIDPATLTYTAAAAGTTVGRPPARLTGTVTGFMGSDTLANATSGTLVWTTDATASSPVGSYAIDGSGLTAANYVFTQSPVNTTALTVAASTSNPGGSSGSTGSSSGGTGTSSGGTGSSSPPPSPVTPAAVFDAIADFDADVLPLSTHGASQPSSAADYLASDASSGGVLELGGNGTLRVEDHGVRLPTLMVPLSP